MKPDDFDRAVLRIANQTPVRIFMDGKHDGSFSHYGLWVLTVNNAGISPPQMLIDELVTKGFAYDGSNAYGQDFTRYEFTAEKVTTST